jgi:hypothetical protein
MRVLSGPSGVEAGILTRWERGCHSPETVMLLFFFGERRHLGGWIRHLAESSLGQM